MKLLLAVCLFLASSTAQESEGSRRCTEALRKALNGRAEWTMERTLGNYSRKILSTGVVECVAGSGIVWRVLSPFESSVSMTTNSMILADEEGARIKPLESLPHYAAIREMTDAFVAGDSHAFDGLFSVTSSSLSNGGWKLVLAPEVSAMTRLFSEIVLTGASLPTNAVLKTGDGGTCVIRFRDISHAR